MAKKKTVFVWILLVLIAISLIIGAFDMITSVIDTDKLVASLALDPVISSITLLLGVVSLIVTSILFYKLYNVTPDVILWVHIAFAFSVARTIVTMILAFLSFGLIAVLLSFVVIIVLIITISMWIGITMHLNRAKRENLMDFS